MIGSIYLFISIGSKAVDVDTIAIYFSHLILLRWCYLHSFTVVLSAPTPNPLFVSGLGTGTGTIFLSCGKVSRCGGSRNLYPNFCPGRSMNLGPGSLNVGNVTTRLPHTLL